MGPVPSCAKRAQIEDRLAGDEFLWGGARAPTQNVAVLVDANKNDVVEAKTWLRDYLQGVEYGGQRVLSGGCPAPSS